MLNIQFCWSPLPAGFLKEMCGKDKVRQPLPQTPIHSLHNPENMGLIICNLHLAKLRGRPKAWLSKKLKGVPCPFFHESHSWTSDLCTLTPQWLGKAHVWKTTLSEKQGRENTYPMTRQSWSRQPTSTPPLLRHNLEKCGPITVLGPECVLQVPWQGDGRKVWIRVETSLANTVLSVFTFSETLEEKNSPKV